jgi:hypothetical protein
MKLYISLTYSQVQKLILNQNMPEGLKKMRCSLYFVKDSVDCFFMKANFLG